MRRQQAVQQPVHDCADLLVLTCGVLGMSEIHRRFVEGPDQHRGERADRLGRELVASQGFRCLAPTWPLGAHMQAMNDPGVLTIEGVAGLVAELVTALRLEDTVLVGNDTGGAVAQVVASTSPALPISALVLTSCDAFEHFPPPILKPLIAAARSARTFAAALQTLRTRVGRRLAYGQLAHADIEALAAEWVRPALGDRAVQRDLRLLTASLERATTVTAGERLGEVALPTLVAWSADDVFFPLEDGRGLAATIPGAQLEVIEAARTFSMIDRPQRLAELIASFAEAPTREPAGTA